MNLHSTLKEWRKGSSINQRDAAGSLGVDFSYLSKIENGHMIPSVDLIERMASLYGRSNKEADLLCMKKGSLPSWVKAAIMKNPDLLEIIRLHNPKSY